VEKKGETETPPLSFLKGEKRERTMTSVRKHRGRGGRHQRGEKRTRRGGEDTAFLISERGRGGGRKKRSRPFNGLGGKKRRRKGRESAIICQRRRGKGRTKGGEKNKALALWAR